MISSEIGDEVDCIATLFSPLAALGLMAGCLGEPLVSFVNEKPDAAKRALEHITETLTRHAQELLSAGASGIFFAPLQWTSLDVCPAPFYAEYGRPYDLQLLAAVADAHFNMLHVCGNNIDTDELYAQATGSLGDLTRKVMLAGGCGIGATTPAASREAVVEVSQRMRLA